MKKYLYVLMCLAIFLHISAVSKAWDIQNITVAYNRLEKCLDKGGWNDCAKKKGIVDSTYDVLIVLQLDEGDVWEDSGAPKISFVKEGKEVSNSPVKCKASEYTDRITCTGTIPEDFYQVVENGQVKAVKTTYAIEFDGEEFESIITNPVPEIVAEIRRIGEEITEPGDVEDGYERFDTNDDGKPDPYGYATILYPWTDWDNDDLINYSDNCPLTSNVDQADTDKDGIGDACDWDIGNDGYFDFVVAKSKETQPANQSETTPQPSNSDDIKPRIDDITNPAPSESAQFPYDGVLRDDGGACSLAPLSSAGSSSGLILIALSTLALAIRRFKLN